MECIRMLPGDGNAINKVSTLIVSGLYAIICSRKVDYCMPWHGKCLCCFRPKMHKIKVHVGEN